jgi:DNA-binding transcriptional LysR family regulator
MQIRLLEYLVALDRERHFARAAAICHVSQPTLSAGLAALEDQLGKRLVDRDRRFIGLTPEGEAVMPWAQQIIAGLHGLTSAAHSLKGPLAGTLRLGAIPASMPITGRAAETLKRLHPELELSIRSLTSRELATFELDAGLTYIDHEPPANVVSMPLYSERAMFVIAKSASGGLADGIAWADALAHPLCLLHQGMQNRRILDEQLAGRSLVATPQATADSYVTLLAMARSGTFATIIPDSYAALVPDWARMIAFEPAAEPSRIGLIVADRTPLSPLAIAALAMAEHLRPQDI